MAHNNFLFLEAQLLFKVCFISLLLFIFFHINQFFLKGFLFCVDIIALLNRIFMHSKMENSLGRKLSVSVQ